MGRGSIHRGQLVACARVEEITSQLLNRTKSYKDTLDSRAMTSRRGYDICRISVSRQISTAVNHVGPEAMEGNAG